MRALISTAHKRLFALVLAATLLQIVVINYFPLDFDEGVHILIARFIQNGYQPYTQVFISRLPLFLLILQGAWIISGESIFISKVVFVVLNSLFLIATGSVGLRLLNEKASLSGVALMALSPFYIAASVALMADLLAAGVGTISAWLTLIYFEDTRRRWLFGAGAVLMIALLIKLLAVYIAVILLLLLALRQIPSLQWGRLRSGQSPSWTAFLLDGGTLFLGGASAMLPALLLFDPRVVYQTTILLRLALRDAMQVSWVDNFTFAQQFLLDNIFLSAGMLLSLFAAYKKAERAIFFLFLWWLIALVWLMMQIPLREQHLLVLWSPMALMGGWALAQIGRRLSGAFKLNSAFKRALPLLGFLAVYSYFGVTQLPGLQDRAKNIYHQKQVNQWRFRPALIDFFQEITTPADCVLSDDPVFLAQINRLPPPNLSEPSAARLDSGSLNLKIIQDAARRRNCQAIISINEKFSQDRLPGIWDWAANFFDHHFAIEGIEVYYNEAKQPIVEQDRVFGDFLRLTGYSLNTAAITPNQFVRLNLYWQPSASLTGAEKVFVQLRNNRGETVARADHILFAETADAAGDGAREITNLQIPPTLSPEDGPYRLYVGLYDPVTLERYPLRNDVSGENAVVIDFPPLP